MQDILFEIAEKIEPRDDALRNRLLNAMSKKDAQAIEMAMGDFEKSVTSGKGSEMDSELLRVAQSQKELLQFRASIMSKLNFVFYLD